MPVPVLLLVLGKKIQKTWKTTLVNQRNFTINLITVSDIYSKWPAESGLVGQGFAIESKGSLFKKLIKRSD